MKLIPNRITFRLSFNSSINKYSRPGTDVPVHETLRTWVISLTSPPQLLIASDAAFAANLGAYLLYAKFLSSIVSSLANSFGFITRYRDPMEVASKIL